MRYYAGSLEQVNEIENKICVNTDLPNQLGTNRWAIPRETIDVGIFAIPVPIDGWGESTYEQIIVGIDAEQITNVQFLKVFDEEDLE